MFSKVRGIVVKVEKKVVKAVEKKKERAHTRGGHVERKNQVVARDSPQSSRRKRSGRSR